MKVTIHTPKNRLLNSDEAYSVALPGSAGGLQIFDGHTPIASTLKSGEIIVEKKSGQKISVKVDHGFFRFVDNELLVLIQKTPMPIEELKAIEKKAIESRNVEIREEEEITEEEFESRK